MKTSKIKLVGIVALMVVLAFTMTACDSDSDSTSRYDVSLTVVDNGGDPVEGAEVTLGDKDAEVTPATGLVEFKDVEEGERTLEIVADGFENYNEPVSVSTEGEDLGEIELTASEMGSVTLSTPDLADGTDVTIKRNAFIQAVADRTETVTDGKVTFSDLPLGFKYDVTNNANDKTTTIDIAEDADGTEVVVDFDEVATDLEVVSVSAINASGVEVEIAELSEDLEAVTVEVVDPDGNTVEVEEEDLLAGTTEVTFQFVETLTEVAEGVWTVDGVEYDKKEANAIVAVNNADSTIKMYDALIEDYGEYFSNVNDDYMAAYVAEFGTNYETIVAIQEDIDAVNEVQDNMDYVTAIEDATTALELRTALRDASNDGFIERYNEDYLEDADAIATNDYVNVHGLAGPTYADFEAVQTNLIDAVNNDNAVAALEAAFADLDQDLVDDANTAIAWVKAETELGDGTNDVLHADETTNAQKPVEEFATDLDNHELFIDVVEADTDLRLKNALQALLIDAADDLGAEHLGGATAADLDMEGIYDVLLADYRAELENNPNTYNLKVIGTGTDGLSAIVDDVNAANPMFDSAEATGTNTITVTATADVIYNFSGEVSDFTVTANGTELAIASVEDTSGVTSPNLTFDITLTDDIKQGQDVLVSYSKDAGGIIPFEDKEVANSVNDMSVANTETAIEFTPAEIGATEPVDVTVTLKDASNNTVATENGEYDVRIRVLKGADLLKSTTRTVTFNSGVITETINDIETAGDLHVEVTVFDMITDGSDVVFDSSNQTNTFTVTAQDAVEFDMALGVDSVINTAAGSNNTIDFSYIKAVDEYGNVDTEYSGAPESKDVLLEVIRDGEVLAIQAVTSSTGVVTLPFSDGEFVVEQIEVDESIVSIFQAGDIVRITDENANISGEIELTDAIIQ